MEQKPSLLCAVDEQDSHLVRAIIPTSPSQDVNRALQLCLAHRESMETLRAILEASPSQYLVDEAFLNFAWSGVFPKTTRELMHYISPGLQKDLYRIQSNARKNGDKSFYCPSSIEEDRHKEIFKKLIPQRLALRKRSIFQSKTWINDLFEAEALCDHRLVVAELLTLPPGPLRPSHVTVANAVLMAISRNNYHMASMLIQYEEGPMDQPTDLLLNQFGMDFLFTELLDMQDLQGVEFVLSRIPIRPDQQLIDNAYIRFSDNTYVERLVRDRLQELKSKSYQLQIKWGKYWRALFEKFKQILEHNVTAEFIETERRRRERQLHRQRLMGRLDGPGITEIHGFSGATVMVPTESGSMDVDQQLHSSSRDVSTEGVEEIGSNQTLFTPPPAPLERKTLIDAVSDYVARKLHLAPLPSFSRHRRTEESTSQSDTFSSATILPSIEVVEEDIIRRIERLFPSARHRQDAIEKLTQGIDSNSQNVLVRIWFYLQQNCPDKIDTWLQGFLGEAVVMHSCNPGVAERVVTGLRGIGDPELDAIFAQAEGPFLARLFLNNAFNFAAVTGFTLSGSSMSREIELQVRRAKIVADYLVHRHGVTMSSTPEEISHGLRKFAEDGIANYQVDISLFTSIIDAVISIAEDMYDDCIKPFVQQVLETASSVSGQSTAGAY